MSWERGRASIERLLASGKLERVRPSEELARRLLADANAHVQLAGKGVDDDPSGALQLSYDAARKASAALLARQGLRATTAGGHVAVIDAVRAQFEDGSENAVFAKIHRLRRRRHATECPAEDSPGVTNEDARRAVATARETIDVANRLLTAGELEPFE